MKLKLLFNVKQNGSCNGIYELKKMRRFKFQLKQTKFHPYSQQKTTYVLECRKESQRNSWYINKSNKEMDEIYTMGNLYNSPQDDPKNSKAKPKQKDCLPTQSDTLRSNDFL